MRCRLAVMERIEYMTLSFLELSDPPVRRRNRAQPSGTSTDTTGLREVQGNVAGRRSCAPVHTAKAVILGLAAVLGPSVAARAQDAPPRPGDAMRLYQRLDGWVRAWQIPTDAGGEAEVKGLTAVAVTLRHEGAIVGRGVEIASPGAGGGLKSLVLAAGQAMSEANTRLPIDRDALFEEHVRAAASRMTISLELAGPLVPIAPGEWSEAALDLAPGIDGVAARIGEQTAAVFPGAMMAGGMDPGRGLAAAVSKAGGDPSLIVKKPPELAKDLGAVFYRFRTTHLAQARPGEPPMFLHRGGRVVETRDLTEVALRHWADGLAGNLMRRRWPGVDKYGLQGTYDPVKGTYEGERPFAGPAEQALAMTALHLYWMGNQNTARGDEVHAAIMALASDLAVVEPGETPAWNDLVAASLFLPFASGAALAEKWREEGRTEFAESARRCRETLDAALDPTGTFAPGVPDAALSLVLCGLGFAAVPEHGPDAETLARRLRAGIQSVYAATPPGGLVGRMPWLGYADLAAAAREQPGRDGRPELRSAVALREMRTLVWKHQLRPEDLPGEQRDLAGGVVFTAARNPLPSWQSARPLAFIAAMLGDPRLTDAKEAPGELARLLASLRFLRQLSASEAEGHMYPNPDRALWGVRASLWDQRQPIEATALTLMTVCETLRSLEARKNRPQMNADER